MLFTFVARQVSRHGADVITVSRTLFEQVVESLCICDRQSTPSSAASDHLEHEQRQQALLELYSAGGLEHFDDDRLITLASAAQFYRVCELVFDRRRQYDEIVWCYWRDPARKHLTFNYVQSVFADKNVSAEDRDRLTQAVMQSVTQLVAIDARKTAKLLLLTLDVNVDAVIEQLNSNNECLFSLLSGLFEVVDSHSAGVPDIHPSLSASVYESYVQVLCRLNRPQSQLVRFLRSTSGYRLAETLAICRQYGATDALVYLLEKAGDVRGAFDMLYGRLTDAVASTTSSCDVDPNLESVVVEITSLLHRASQQMDADDVETVWFMTLDSLMEAIKLLKTTSPLDTSDQHTLTSGGRSAVDMVKSVTRQLINAMMTHVALPAVLQRIIVNDDGVTAQFGDVRDLLTGVLDACCYETTLLSTCASLVSGDLHSALAALTRASRAPVASALTDSCVCCGQYGVGPSVPLARHAHDLVCFNCGHLAHKACLNDSSGNSPAVAASRDATWKCPVCCRSAGSRSGSSAPVPLLRSAAANSQPLASSQSAQLDCVQTASIDRWRSVSRSGSRLSVLSQLAQLDHSRSVAAHPRSRTSSHHPTSTSVLHNEQFALRLSVPPPPTQS